MYLPPLLFFHVLAVCGLFAGMGIELAAFARFRQASSLAQAREALCHVTLVGPIMRGSVLLLLAAGIGMVYYAGIGWAPWVVTVFVLTVVMAALGGAVNGKRLDAAHGECASGEGPLPQTVLAARADGLLNFTVAVLPCILVIALYLMITKPGVAGCIAAAVVALVAGAVLGRLWSSRTSQASAAFPQ